MDSNPDTLVIAQSEGDIESVSPSKRRKLFPLWTKVTLPTRQELHIKN